MRPQGQRPCDRAQRVPPTCADRPWSHHEDGCACPALVPASPHLGQRRRRAWSQRSLDRAGSESVTHDLQSAAGLAARCAARRASSRAYGIAGRRTFGPRLDVHLAMDDSLRASRLRLQRLRGARRDAVLDTPPPPLYFAGTVPVLRLRPRLYDGLGAARDKPASPMPLTPRTPSPPSPSSRYIPLPPLIHPAR
jgi:hypothetical protein